jgi:hypothetical protein
VGVAVFIPTFPLWSLEAAARHDAFCRHVASAAKLIYGETTIEQGTRQALTFLKQVSGDGQLTVGNLRTCQKTFSRENWSQPL